MKISGRLFLLSSFLVLILAGCSTAVNKNMAVVRESGRAIASAPRTIYDGENSKYKKVNDFIGEQILGKTIGGTSHPLPYLFNVPKNAHKPLEGFRTEDIFFDYFHPLSKDNNDENKIGLRLYIVNNEETRLSVTKRLAKSKAVQNGDVLLTFHPEWGGTGPYPSLMTGISHAGMAYIDRGTVKNIDMPLNQAQNFKLGSANLVSTSNLDSDHYVKHTKYIHIIRPMFGANQEKYQTNLYYWAKRFAIRNRVLGRRGRRLNADKAVYPSPLKFNSNYLSPAYMLQKTNDPFAHILDIARVGYSKSGLVNEYYDVATGNPTKVLPLFCSDFIWSLHALRACNGKDGSIEELNSNCKPDPMFDPIGIIGSGPNVYDPDYVPGSTDAALLVLKALDIRGDTKIKKMVNEVFEQKFPYLNISSGHKKAAKTIDPQLYGVLSKYWISVLSNSDSQPFAQGINASGMPKNYAPTTFLVNALLPYTNNNKKYEYVGTIVFADADVYEDLNIAITKASEPEPESPPAPVQARRVLSFAEASAEVSGFSNTTTDRDAYYKRLIRENTNISTMDAGKVRKFRMFCYRWDRMGRPSNDPNLKMWVGGKRKDYNKLCKNAKNQATQVGIPWEHVMDLANH